MNPLRRPLRILLAEDDPEDQMLTRDAFREAAANVDLFIVEDGEELLAFLRCKGPYSAPGRAPRPDLILLDLNMPRMNGREALAEIKKDPDLRRIPVIALTVSKAEEDVLRTYDLGVAGYVVKPMTFRELVEVTRSLSLYWSQTVELPVG